MINNSSLLISGRKYTYAPFTNRFYTIKLDTTFNVVKHTIYQAPASHSYSTPDGLTVPSIDKNGNSLFAALKDSVSPGFIGTSNECYYFMTDSNLNVLSQKHLNIAQTGFNSKGYSQMCIRDSVTTAQIEKAKKEIQRKIETNGYEQKFEIQKRLKTLYTCLLYTSRCV